MPIPTPSNEKQASYIALAMVSALIDVLISKQVIGESDVASMLHLVVNRLEAFPNGDSKRAARFLAERMKVQE